MDNKLAELVRDKVVLVTGGTGSIGSEIVRKLLEQPVRQIRLLSRDEYKQFVLEQELKHLPKGKVRFLIGDIRDRDRVFLAAEGVDLIFNAAAMKHVHLSEYNPFESVKTNVLGTQNLVDAARTHNVEKFVHISTDKAALPGNVMGATKLLAERIVISAERYLGNRRTVFCAVRFGNVLASRGSVIPIFLDQIKRGGPVTLTEPAMTRFMMSIPQAAGLVLDAAVLSRGSELFILKMPVLKIEDLAKAMIELYAPKFGHRPGDIKTEVIGRREGEKIYELLMTDVEAEEAQENDRMFCLSRRPLAGYQPSHNQEYRSDRCRVMNYGEVLAFLKQMLPAVQ